MSLDRVEELWTRFLEERELPPAEEAELLRALESDPALRERLLQDKELDGLVDALNTTDRDAGAFLKSFADRLSVEGDGPRFIAKVERRLRQESRRAPRPGSSAWMPILVAAGVFAAIVLVAVFVGTSGSPLPRVAERPAPRPQAPVPERKAPAEIPPPPPPPVEKKEDDLRRRAEDVIRKPVDPPPPPERPPVPAPRQSPPPAPPAPKEFPTPAPTKAAVALILKLERVEGEVSVGGRKDVKAGLELPAGESVETGPDASAALGFRDGTRVELGTATAAQEIQDAPKRIVLPRGILSADVPRQTQPMTVRTPHAEARVLGTSFRITVDATSTRLEVKSGKVRLTRLSDGKWVDVSAGQFAVAGAAAGELAAKSLAAKARPVLLSEPFDDPAGVESRWTPAGGLAAVKTSGRLEIDLSKRAPEGWSGGGLRTKQDFAPPFAVTAEVEAPVLHAGVVTALVLIPQGKKRLDDGVLRVQIRERRYGLWSEFGDPKELAGAGRPGGAPVRERWRVEVVGNLVRFLVNDRELFRHKPDGPAPAGYGIEFDASARADAPAAARAAFDTVVVEPLRP